MAFVIEKTKPTLDIINKHDIILVGTHINCSLTNGYQHDIKMLIPQFQKMNLATRYGDSKKLGTMEEYVTSDGKILILCFICKNNYNPKKVKDFLDYEALERIIRLINIKYRGKTVITNLIGSSPFDGNGDINKILEILHKYTTNITLTLLDYKERSYKDILFEHVKKIMILKNGDDKYAYHKACEEYKTLKETIKKINNISK